MFNLFKKPAPKVVTRVHTVVAKAPEVDIKRVTGGALRNGMWVEVGERVGILTDMNQFGVCAVMIVEPVEGANVALIQVPSGEVRQARQMAIPKKRVAHLEPHQLERLGYI